MARMSKAERFSQTKERIDNTYRWRSEEGYDAKWRRMIDLYRGKTFGGGVGGYEGNVTNDRISVNMAFSTVNVIGPSVAVNHPTITVVANQEGDESRAVFVEAVINYLWRHHDYRKPFRRAVKDFLIIGHGWLKVGWRFVEQERDLSPVEMAEEYNRATNEVDQFAYDNPEMMNDLPSDEDVMDSIPHKTMEVVEDQAFVERISPFDMMVDPEATCLEDARWICQRIVRPLAEVKKDTRYKRSVRQNLVGDAGVRYRWDGDDERERYNEVSARVTLYEYYDLENGTLSVCASSGDDYLLDPQPMPYHMGHPFAMIRNYDVPDVFYPMGDLEAIESLQEELNKTRSQMVNHRKRYARKYLYHERSFGPEGREALESDDDGRFVPVIDENRDLAGVVQPLPQVPLAPEMYNHSNVIEGDINTVSGVSEYARGQMPETRRTATEASIIVDAGNARAADKLATVEISISEVARMVMQLMMQYMTDAQMVRITGKDDQKYFVAYTRDDIIGEFDFAVEGGSTQPFNETARRQQAISLLNAMAPLIGTVVDPAEIAKHVLSYGFGINDPDRYMIQQQTPLDAQVAQEESGGVADPFGAPPMSQGGMGPGPIPQQVFEGTSGVPPELINQLQNQMGVELPNMQ